MEQSSQHDRKKCAGCRRMLPFEFYGFMRTTTDKMTVLCKPCTADWKRRAYKRKHGHVRPEAANNHPVIHSVSKNNEPYINLGILRLDVECLAFHTVTGTEYKVRFQESVYKLPEIIITELQTGNVFFAQSFGGNDRISTSKFIHKILLTLDLRLEKDEVTMAEAKTLVYHYFVPNMGTNVPDSGTT